MFGAQHIPLKPVSFYLPAFPSSFALSVCWVVVDAGVFMEEWAYVALSRKTPKQATIHA